MKKIGAVETEYGIAHVNVGRYPKGGAIYVQLNDLDGQAMTTLSTNLRPYGASIADDEFCVKTWSENESLIPAMKASGLFVDTGKRVSSGHVVSPVWGFVDPRHVPAAVGHEDAVAH